MMGFFTFSLYAWMYKIGSKGKSIPLKYRMILLDNRMDKNCSDVIGYKHGGKALENEKINRINVYHIAHGGVGRHGVLRRFQRHKDHP